MILLKILVKHSPSLATLHGFSFKIPGFCEQFALLFELHVMHFSSFLMDWVLQFLVEHDEHKIDELLVQRI